MIENMKKKKIWTKTEDGINLIQKWEDVKVILDIRQEVDIIH